ncbi:MAG: 30S ribosomal protein S18 [Planctomycetota bacterium]|jgi:small subunit ribosomal protein S18
MPRPRRFNDRARCRFCREKVSLIDYKDIQSLQKLTTGQGKLFSRKRSGNCAKHQRQAKLALKRARFIALMPYVGGQS